MAHNHDNALSRHCGFHTQFVSMDLCMQVLKVECLAFLNRFICLVKFHGKYFNCNTDNRQRETERHNQDCTEDLRLRRMDTQQG